MTSMQASRWVPLAERGCLTILFAWLVWLPLPFGSVVEGARMPLIAVPLALGAAAIAIRISVIRARKHEGTPTRAWSIWASGGLLLSAAALLQLVPLGPGVLAVLSPESKTLWQGASQVAAIAGVAPRVSHPLTIDPAATAAELLRMIALVATFATSALLVRSPVRRRAMALALCAAAVFESMYGLREAALQRYEIWGWANRLIFDRVTGTFVNPNHFAHYLAIVLPMPLFLAATLWHRGGEGLSAGRRVAFVLEHHAFFAGLAMLSAMACLAGILLSQSRGVVVALAASVLGVAAMIPGRRRGLRIALAAAAGLVLVVTLALFLGKERTIARFTPETLEQNAPSRRWSAEAALRIWRRFPIFGSGYGTFERVVSLEQNRDTDKIYNHAHNDYAELAATGGSLGLLLGAGALFWGAAALVRATFGAGARELSWSRRAFQTAALVSLGIAIVHAFFDFNFFIPANPATLASILGAAVAPVDHDRRTRR